MSEVLKGPMYAPYNASHYNLRYGDDLQRWNWRWMVKGTVRDDDFDDALLLHFNKYQREAMTWEPAVAFDWFKNVVPEQVTSEIQARMIEAQSRLFPPRIAGHVDNVTYVNFRRYKG